ncbi:hypothetical protein FHS96_003739 [Sphingomonas zeicaulis]|uniref:hypothetical protein n=1 Tax=Sphingomonas zeicaulis TaxID=1632740 RepID=UPI003D1B0F0F
MKADLFAHETRSPRTLVYGAPTGLTEAAPAIERTPAPEGAPRMMPPANPPAAPPPSLPFGNWLLGQHGRSDWIGDLARAAKADRAFPKAGDADAARHRLSAMGAEADMFEALEAAEIEWLCF